MPRDRLTNPANASFYDFHINHDEESGGGRERAIEHTTTTAGTGLVRQQGDKAPTIKRVSGSILHAVQYRRLWEYFELCDTQTVYFKSATGWEAEVTLTKFEPQEVRVENRKDPSIPWHKWTYTLEMEVVRWIAGQEATAGVDP